MLVMEGGSKRKDGERGGGREGVIEREKRREEGRKREREIEKRRRESQFASQ